MQGSSVDPGLEGEHRGTPDPVTLVARPEVVTGGTVREAAKHILYRHLEYLRDKQLTGTPLDNLEAALVASVYRTSIQERQTDRLDALAQYTTAQIRDMRDRSLKDRATKELEHNGNGDT